MVDIGNLIVQIITAPLIGRVITAVIELFSPLRKFWKPFLREGGIIVIPPYPKNRSNYSVKSGTGYSDCIAAGEIRGILGFLRLVRDKDKDIKVKEGIQYTEYREYLYEKNLIVIGGPISNQEFFMPVTEKEQSLFVLEKDHFIYYNGKKKYISDEKTGYGLLYLIRKTIDLESKNKMNIVIAGCHGDDTRQLAEMLTNRKCIKRINSDPVIKKNKSASAVFILKYNKDKDIRDTSPDHIIEDSVHL